MVDGFARLKMAMELKSAVQKHKRAISITRDRERSEMDKLKAHDKHLVTAFRSSTWCRHLKEAFIKKALPNQFSIRNSNVFCLDCAKFVDESNGNIESRRRDFVPMKSDALEQLATMYTTKNIEITYWNRL